MKIKLNLPETFDQLTFSQLKKIIKASEARVRGRFSIAYLFVVLAVPHPFAFWRMIKTVITLFNIPYYDLKPFVENFFKMDDLTRFIPKIRHYTKTLYGPADKLVNITIEEFAFADLFFYQWITNKKDIDALNRLVSVLYRPRAVAPTKIDKRALFEKLLLPNHAPIVQKIDLTTKLTIAYAYSGSRQRIEKMYPMVFPKSKNKNNTAVKKYHSFNKLITSLANSENKPFGNLTQTKKANLFDFLAIFTEELIREKNRQ